MTSFRTPTRRTRHEISRIKNSRFVATLAPADSAEAALEAVRAVATEMPDARHHCWAYRIGAEGREYRFSDDGEPGGSAGRPILAVLEGREVADAALVVSRWFGGVKLGVGGLVRAYGAAAAAVLEEAELRCVVPLARVRAVFPYQLTAAVQALLARRDLTPIESRYELDVELVFEVPEADAKALADDLLESTAGRGAIELRSIGE